jgi:hypothetical protein
MKTGTRANRLPTPRVRSNSTNALLALVMAPAVYSRPAVGRQVP